jgi:hypothetical protein
MASSDVHVHAHSGRGAWWHAGRVLCTPLVLIVGSLVAASQSAIGFIDVALAVHIQDISVGVQCILCTPKESNRMRRVNPAWFEFSVRGVGLPHPSEYRRVYGSPLRSTGRP